LWWRQLTFVVPALGGAVLFHTSLGGAVSLRSNGCGSFQAEEYTILPFQDMHVAVLLRIA
jgi:hypothetical protein